MSDERTMFIPQAYELWAPVWKFPHYSPHEWYPKPWQGPREGRDEWRYDYLAAMTDTQIADKLDDWASLCRVIGWPLVLTSDVGAYVSTYAIAAGGDADWEFAANTAEECRALVLARFRIERDKAAAARDYDRSPERQRERERNREYAREHAAERERAARERAARERYRDRH